MQPLPLSFYDRDVLSVAPSLLGMRLLRRSKAGLTSGRIVEVEAYRGAEDPASHAYRGPTRRNASMFGPPGRAYIYTIHTRFCLNAVAHQPASACGVLIRAIEPLDGLRQMAARRGTTRRLDLARGPGRLCEALDIDRRLDGWNLTLGRRLWIAADGPPVHIGSSPRIGLSKAVDRPWRFFVDGNPFVSGPRKHHARPLDKLEPDGWNPY